MTPAERQEKEELAPGRRKRICERERRRLDDVNRMVKGFKRVKQLFKNMPDMKAQAKKMGCMPDLERTKETI